MERIMEKYREIEKSIIKKFRKEIWCRFTLAIRQYQLIQAGDKVAVCISGGKDSVLMAKCVQELQRHGQIQFEAVFLVMDPGYSRANRTLIEANAAMLNIPLTFFETQIFEIVDSVGGGSPCYLCARMRRGYLYNNAKALGCNKIALGHHYDDVLETILLSMLYGGEIKTMMPKLHSTNFEGMELIRPMYMIKEENILKWKDYNDLKFLNCACRFTENGTVSTGEGGKRLEMKELIQQFRKTSPMIEHNIFKSVENVHMNAVTGYTKDGIKHSFLDEY
jgi:tRNA(Ile)-lysidine synthase TilS/MesJ